ncbi:wall-associated receptor kinase 2-like protein [Tanacetum coccineum]
MSTVVLNYLTETTWARRCRPGIGLSLLTMLIGLSILYIMAKKRKLAKLKEKFFEQNGGALLTEKLKSKGGTGLGSVNIFGVEELEEATDNFAEGKILGKGGNGTVYKGTLPDKRVVAIKKSQKLDKEQREQFINEMVILTLITQMWCNFWGFVWKLISRC